MAFCPFFSFFFIQLNPFFLQLFFFWKFGRHVSYQIYWPMLLKWVQMKNQHLNVAYVWIERLISFYHVNMSTVVLALKNGNVFFFIFKTLSIASYWWSTNTFGIWFILFRNESHDNCPICQTNLKGINDSWVLSELPKTNEVNEEILTELNALTNDSSNELMDAHPNEDDDSDDWLTKFIQFLLIKYCSNFKPFLDVHQN